MLLQMTLTAIIIVQFQKIPIPTQRKVNGNFKGEEGFKSTIFKGRYDTKLEFLEGLGDSN